MIKRQISVRAFASDAMRRGHIDQFSGYRPELFTGVEIHSKIQRRRADEYASYQREICLETQFQHEHLEWTVNGRLDGYYLENERHVVEEIKSTTSISRLKAALDENTRHPYLLQALCYAYILKATRGIPVDQLQVQLLLIGSTDESEYAYPIKYDEGTFLAWVSERLAQLHKEERFLENEQTRRQVFKEQMSFPFEQLRPAQNNLVESVKAIVQEKKRALLEAPTGLGKTAATMFPSLQDALERKAQLIYVTPKNSQLEIAEEFLERLRAKTNEPLRSMTLTAKAKICMQEEVLCTPEHCPFAKNYYDKLHENDILGKLRSHQHIDREVLRDYALRHEVCPFELSLELAPEVDVIIGDYNYVFAPKAQLLSLLCDEDGEKKNANLLIDECHNLAARACSFFSPTLTEKEIVELSSVSISEDQNLEKKWQRLTTSVIKVLDEFRDASSSNADFCETAFDRDVFFGLQARLQKFSIEYFQEIETLKANDPVLSLMRRLDDFCTALELFDEGFFALKKTTTTNQVELKVLCCDASAYLKEVYQYFYAVVGFSATLSPFDYHAKLCGLDSEELITASFPSPFDMKQRKVMIIPQVSTRLKDRANNYARIAEAIERISAVCEGNYLVFFPSYLFLEAVEKLLDPKKCNIRVQKRGMSNQDVQKILQEIRSKEEHLIILAVQGGSFSEGIDLPGNLLQGVIVVGPGLPTFDAEHEIMRRFFEKRYRNGFLYTYIIPAMTKVVQAAGRTVRTPTDRGLIVLMDQRFGEAPYIDLLPTYWHKGQKDQMFSRSILNDIREFWNTPL